MMSARGGWEWSSGGRDGRRAPRLRAASSENGRAGPSGILSEEEGGEGKRNGWAGWFSKECPRAERGWSRKAWDGAMSA